MSNDQGKTAATKASRRAVIKGMAAAAAAACLPSEAMAAQLPISAFLDASSKLSGIALDQSYMQLGETLWHLLTLDGTVKMRALVFLVNHTPEEHLERDLRLSRLEMTAQTVLSAWYRGMVSVLPKHFRDPVVLRSLGDLSGLVDPKHPKRAVSAVLTYDEALVWHSCTFTKPSATCGGPFGYWQNPPA